MNKFIKASLVAAMLAAPIMADEEFCGGTRNHFDLPDS
jgi:hypothetical protein